MTVTILFYNTEITFTWTPYSFKLEIINELRSVGINLRSEPSSNAKKETPTGFFKVHPYTTLYRHRFKTQKILHRLYHLKRWLEKGDTIFKRISNNHFSSCHLWFMSIGINDTLCTNDTQKSCGEVAFRGIFCFIRITYVFITY